MPQGANILRNIICKMLEWEMKKMKYIKIGYKKANNSYRRWLVQKQVFPV